MKSSETIQVVDAIALQRALRKAASGAEFYCKGKEISVYDSHLADSLVFWVDRYAMDNQGYDVGYEQYVGKFKLFSKSKFQQMWGSPYAVSPWFIFPKIWDLVENNPARPEEKWTLKEMKAELDNIGIDIKGLPSDEIKQLFYDHEFGDAYCPADNDFAEEELGYCVSEALKVLPEWEFKGGESRIWKIDGYEFNLDEMVEISKKK
jgi:hypothetical protein